jgi:hypothetical protein
VDDDTDRDRDKERQRQDSDIYRDRDRDKDRDRDRDITCRDIYRHSRHQHPALSPLNIHTRLNKMWEKGGIFSIFFLFLASGY